MLCVALIGFEPYIVFPVKSRSFLLRFEVSLDSKLYFYYSNSIARRKEKENEKFPEENL